MARESTTSNLLPVYAGIAKTIIPEPPSYVLFLVLLDYIYVKYMPPVKLNPKNQINRNHK
jgi:hypothetical protein